MSHTGGLYCPICSHRRQVKVRPTPSLALQDSIQALKTILDMLKVAENFYNIEDDNTDIYQEYAYCKNEVTTRLNRVGNPNIRDALDKALGSIECSVEEHVPHTQQTGGGVDADSTHVPVTLPTRRRFEAVWTQAPRTFLRH